MLLRMKVRRQGRADSKTTFMMKCPNVASAPTAAGRLVLTTIVLALSWAMAGCAAKQVKTPEQIEAEVEQADLALIVNRNLYVATNARNTFFQDGYAQKKNNIDKYDPFCRFSINYELAGDVDTTRILAQRMAITTIRRARDTASSEALQLAAATEIHAGVSQIDSWVTRLVLKSAKQPWITGLDCEIFASRDSYLTLDDIREVVDPSMSLEAPQE